MGNFLRQPDTVKITADVPGIVSPLLKSVMSDPFHDKIDFDTYWDTLVEFIKGGGLNNDPSLKEWKIAEETPSHFITMKTFDGVKLGLPDDLVLRQMYLLDKGRGLIWEDMRPMPQEKLREVGVIFVHRWPLRVEAWRQKIRDGRNSDEGVALKLYGLLVNALDTPDVKVTPDEDSIWLNGAACAMSQDLSTKCAGFAELWTKMLHVLRMQAYNPLKKSVDVWEITKDKGDGVSSFMVHSVQDGASLAEARLGFPGGPDRLWTIMVRADREKRTISIETVDQVILAVLDVQYLVFHEEPCLRVECWTHDPEDRRHGFHIRIVVDLCVNTVIGIAKLKAAAALAAAAEEGKAVSSEGVQAAAGSSGARPEGPQSGEPAE